MCLSQMINWSREESNPGRTRTTITASSLECMTTAPSDREADMDIMQFITMSVQYDFHERIITHRRSSSPCSAALRVCTVC